jgi:hypothetical protein
MRSGRCERPEQLTRSHLRGFLRNVYHLRHIPRVPASPPRGALRPVHRFAPFLLAASLYAFSGPAVAEQAVPKATSVLNALSVSALPESYQQALAEPVERAKAALERAAAAREGRQTKRAQLLEALALEWARVAHSLQGTAELEQRATALEKQRHQLQVDLERARVLLEETSVREGRAKAQLKSLQADTPTQPGPDRTTSKSAPSAPTTPAAPQPEGDAK